MGWRRAVYAWFQNPDPPASPGLEQRFLEPLSCNASIVQESWYPYAFSWSSVELEGIYGSSSPASIKETQQGIKLPTSGSTARFLREGGEGRREGGEEREWGQEGGREIFPGVLASVAAPQPCQWDVRFRFQRFEYCFNLSPKPTWMKWHSPATRTVPSAFKWDFICICGS